MQKPGYIASEILMPFPSYFIFQPERWPFAVLGTGAGGGPCPTRAGLAGGEEANATSREVKAPVCSRCLPFAFPPALPSPAAAAG